jgi:hypothetical protein
VRLLLLLAVVMLECKLQSTLPLLLLLLLLSLL